jgi:ATP-dependent Clp protease adaptor protein ClpS
MEKEKTKSQKKEQELKGESRELILFNDDFNTFDFVIETLIDVCGHDINQAETCAWITHFNGKCAVKSGTFKELKPMFDEMSLRDLTVSID